MRNNFTTIFFLILLTVFSCNAQGSRVEDQYLSKLTLMEKLSILTGPGNYQPINLKKPVSGVAGYINGVLNQDLDLPALKLADGPAGVRIAQYTTAWPVGTLLASTWDTELVLEVGKAIGQEAKEFGIDFLLAPGMNIQRNPLAGRNFEYYSEDPLLTGKIGASMVTGVQSNGIGSTIKHFVANESETNRNYLNVVSDPRTLREIYLRGFKIAIQEAKPWAVMSSYNLLNGTYVNQRKDVLTEILRNEWGFSGLVMSDWYAGNVYGDPDSAAKQIKAGNDLIMPGLVIDHLRDSYEKGFLTEDEIDKSVLRILNKAIKTPSYNSYNFSNKPELEIHTKLARRAGAEGMILLKNDGFSLPLDSESKVAIFGVAQNATYKGGTGSGNVNSEYVIDIITGLSNRFRVNPELKTFYRNYFDSNKTSRPDPFASIPIYSVDEASFSKNKTLYNLLEESAVSDDSAIITISRQAGEGQDRQNIRGEYLLNENELEMIIMVSKAFKEQNKKVSVILNIDGVIDTTQWSGSVDSILLAYMGGQETGNQIADIISGDVNPSGKLTQTFPKKYDDVPSAKTFPGVDVNKDGDPDYIINNEGIYIGYRYYTTFDKEVSYPFGFGLSYTTFDISGSKIVKNTLEGGESGLISILTNVINTGEIPGKEVTQVYIKSPEVKLDKPVIELKSFKKTKLLKGGDSEDLIFEIPAMDMASFDMDRNLWILEPGEYSIYITSSSDISKTVPIIFSIKKEIIVNEAGDILSLQEDLKPSDILSIFK